MAAEQQWVSEGVVPPGDADGRECIFCKQRIVGESQPVHWVQKAVEDDQDTDYPLADGYAHQACSAQQRQKESRGRFTLPEVPNI